ncbi:MAG TPA: hypothetical protein VIO61_11615 [Anaerolineaceae bacterium]
MLSKLSVIDLHDAVPVKRSRQFYLTASGIFLVGIGLAFFIEQIIHTGWLLFSLPLVIGCFCLFEGIQTKMKRFIIGGSLVTGIGAGLLLGFSSVFSMDARYRVGILLFCFGISWGLISSIAYILLRQALSWALVPGGIILSVSSCFFFGSLRFVDFVFYIVTGLGIVLFSWGYLRGYFGLIIPGGILLGIGPGIYYAWRNTESINGLTQTGVMLVWFALGWLLVSLASRRTMGFFIWWPLIPGAILAAVGWGLYIGGDPNNAINFIGNSGSIVLIIFGLYLMLLRKGIHK